MAKTAIFLADGFEEIEALTVVDLLRRAGIEITTASIMGRKSVEGSHKITVEADAQLEDLDFDIFAKGPDQTHDGFKRAVEWCENHGKKVVVIPRTEGISSTLLRDYSMNK